MRIRFALLLLVGAVTAGAAPPGPEPGDRQVNLTRVNAQDADQHWWLAKGLRIVTYEFLERNWRTNDLSPDEILAILDRFGGCDLVLLKGFHSWQGRFDDGSWGYPRFHGMAAKLIPKLHARGTKTGVFGFTDWERSYRGGPASKAGQLHSIAQHVHVIGEMGYTLFLQASGDYGIEEVTRQWSRAVKGDQSSRVAYWTGGPVEAGPDRGPGSVFWRERFADRTLAGYFEDYFRRARASGADGVFFHSVCRFAGLPEEKRTEVAAAIKRVFKATD
jgi:hypothetical protein